MDFGTALSRMPPYYVLDGRYKLAGSEDRVRSRDREAGPPFSFVLGSLTVVPADFPSEAIPSRAKAHVWAMQKGSAAAGCSSILFVFPLLLLPNVDVPWYTQGLGATVASRRAFSSPR